ncbi:VOC family protein [Actinorugispora endophytica]|uniref:Putative enzyme related to lactoylglutathione lyase n=1 Tax=Actinorugispora endophytica TaxID=1605990 RepID=A0A4R6UVM1_9ACTN|nr:VOC family protein [Actinorugispora endophytica]TDQ51438.1 putative enzyme related to lactoylglutathione lyase [Actinorugispora endophytica]
MTSTATLAMVTIDCADPARLSAFYAAVLGWEVRHSEDEYAMIAGEGTPIGFGRVPGHQPPTWPDESGAKRFHLDTHVTDLAEAEARFVRLGATRPVHQPGGERWRVLLDPEGHPFCVCPRPAE